MSSNGSAADALTAPPAAPPTPGERQSAAADTRTHEIASVRTVVQMIAGPATITTALLFYFGWNRTQSIAGYFGLDQRLFGFSTQDYLLRSIDAMFLPIIGVVVVGLAWVSLDRMMTARMEAGRPMTRPWRLAPAVTGAVGAALVVWGAIGSAQNVPGSRQFARPLSTACGTALAAYAIFLFRRMRASDSDGKALPRASAVQLALVGVLFTTNLFWAVADYAGAIGQQRAKVLAASLPSQPGVVLHSRQRLHIDAPGVTETELGDVESAYRYRYEGLRLLLHSAKKYFLLPADWTPQGGAVIVLPEGDAPRLDFVRS